MPFLKTFFAMHINIATQAPAYFPCFLLFTNSAVVDVGKRKERTSTNNK